ncbi:MAG: hypothetical protein R2849_19490 [Thermomicrobiales bacterium]
MDSEPIDFFTPEPEPEKDNADDDEEDTDPGDSRETAQHVEAAGVRELEMGSIFDPIDVFPDRHAPLHLIGGDDGEDDEDSDRGEEDDDDDFDLDDMF